MDDPNDINQLPFKKNLPPNVSLQTYFLLMFVIVSLVAGIVGYSLAYRISTYTAPVSQTPSKSISITPTLLPNDDNDIDYFRMSGTLTTDTSYYDELYVYVDEWKNGVMTHQQNDNRMAFKVQPGIAYPFTFNRLDPKLTYIFTASACHSGDNGLCHRLAKKIAITSCSGQIQGVNCVMKASESGQGYVDFVVHAADNPVATISVTLGK